jgi:hypothetical protein
LTASHYYAGSSKVSSLPQPKTERRTRRSARLKLTFPVLVHGKKLSGEPFRETTRTLSVSLHGGLLLLTATLESGQTLLVENKGSRKEQECRVVFIGPMKYGKWPVGIEFAGEARNFWGIFFPPLS